MGGELPYDPDDQGGGWGWPLLLIAVLAVAGWLFWRLT